MLRQRSRNILRASINGVRRLVGLEPLDARTTLRGELEQAGQIIVVFALMLTVLIRFMGIAIDATYAWREALRVQRAADAASLASVVYMPGDFNSAKTYALAEAAKNGMPSSGTTVVGVYRATNPDELDVSITTQVRTFFSRIFGINSFAVTRASRAPFMLPVPMGSTENYYGNMGKYCPTSPCTTASQRTVTQTGPNGEALNAHQPREVAVGGSIPALVG